MATYIDISDDIKEKIMTGFYKRGAQLPKQIELAKLYDTSRVTIQKAFDILSMEGFIVAIKGTGTFVREDIPTDFLLDSKATEYVGVTKKLAGKGRLTSEIISFEARFPTEVEMEKLQIAQEAPIYDIIRLRLLNNDPILLEYTVMPIEVIPGVTNKVLKKSVYQYIQEDLGLTIGSAVRRIHADRPDAYDKKFLLCEPTDPVMEIDQVAYLIDGRPFEYSQTRHRFDKGDITFTSYKF